MPTLRAAQIEALCEAHAVVCASKHARPPMRATAISTKRQLPMMGVVKRCERVRLPVRCFGWGMVVMADSFDAVVIGADIGGAASTLEIALSVFGELVPAFRTARIESIWAGLIDQTPNALPVLDTVPEVDGLAIAMGFSGHGFCLGPLTGKLRSDFVHRRPAALPLDAFKLARFDGWNGPAQPLPLHG